MFGRTEDFSVTVAEKDAGVEGEEEEDGEEEEGEEEEGGGGGGAGGVGGGGGGGEAAKASLDFCWCFFIVLTPDCHFMLLVKYFNALHGMYQSIPVGNG